MVSGEAVPGGQRPGDQGEGDSAAGSDEAPTPPHGLPLGQPNAGEQPDLGEETPPQGIEGLAELVRTEDLGSAGPAVLGGVDPVTPDPDGGGDWPTLEYRSRRDREGRSRGRFGWSRRQNEET